MSVTNSTGTLDRITLTRVNIGLNSVSEGNDGIHLESQSTAGELKATIQDTTFTGARGDLVDYSHNGTGSGDLVISNSSFSNNHPGIVTGGVGLSLSSSGTGGNTTFDITSNTFRDAVGTGVLIVKTAGSSTQTGTFSNNTIGVSGVSNSGSAEGSGLELQNLGQGTMTWGVTNNRLRAGDEQQHRCAELHHWTKQRGRRAGRRGVEHRADGRWLHRLWDGVPMTRRRLQFVGRVLAALAPTPTPDGGHSAG